MTIVLFMLRVVDDMKVVCVHRYLGDGRFHLESIMIANPRIPAYRHVHFMVTFSLPAFIALPVLLSTT